MRSSHKRDQHGFAASARPTAAQVRRRRLGAVGSLAGMVALMGLLLASAGGDATDQSTNLSTSASPPPPLACPAKGHAVSTSAAGNGSPTTGNSSHNVTWAGVFERVFVTDSMDGSVKKTPHQFTHVATAGHGPATVDVPMSSSHLRRRSQGKKPQVVNGVAQIKVNPDGSAIDRLDADYERPLPVSVKVTYKLNGQPISAGDIKRKSGTVETDYQLTNTTPKPVKVCFVGFNGKLVKKTVTAPSPILAYLSFNVPKNVAEFTAPKASIGATISGVGVQAAWLHHADAVVHDAYPQSQDPEGDAADRDATSVVAHGTSARPIRRDSRPSAGSPREGSERRRGAPAEGLRIPPLLGRWAIRRPAGIGPQRFGIRARQAGIHGQDEVRLQPAKPQLRDLARGVVSNAVADSDP